MNMIFPKILAEMAHKGKSEQAEFIAGIAKNTIQPSGVSILHYLAY